MNSYNILVDASAMIALFDDNDKHHAHYNQVFEDLSLVRAKLYTTWPCVTEASYFLAPANHLALLAWLHAGAAQLYPLEAYHLQTFIPVMKTYSERNKTQMDLADASLYFVAQAVKSHLVLSLDKRDFERYRLPNGQSFEVL